jgi:RsiW-degrading membrane proteinase PrsW (M82 family)
MKPLLNNSHYHHGETEPKLLLSVVLALIIPCVLWIVFTSIRQLVRKYKYYDFFEENHFALITIFIVGGITLFMFLAEFIYTLIK